MAKPRQTSSIDAEIGLRLRRKRLSRKLTQDELGDAIGVSYQQIQKYETGRNRVAAGTLWRLARVLECTVDEFLPDESFEKTTSVGVANDTAANVSRQI